MPLTVLRGTPVSVRTVLPAAAMWATALSVLLTAQAGPPSNEARVPLLVLTALFFLGGWLVVAVEARNSAHAITLTEAPLVIGLFLADPLTLLVARLSGQLLALVFLPRQPPWKVAANATLWVAETSVALAVVAMLVPPHPSDPVSWLVVIGAVVLAGLLSHLAVRLVSSRHERRRASLVTVTPTALGTSAVHACLGLLAVLLLQVHLAALAVLAVLAALGHVCLRSHVGLQQRHESLLLLHDVTVALGRAVRPDQVVEALLHHARQLLRARVADLVVLRADGSADLQVTLQGDDPIRFRAIDPEQRRLLAALARGGSVLRARGGCGPADPYLDALHCRDGLFVAAPLEGGDHLLLTVGQRLGDVRTFIEQDRRLFDTLVQHAAAAVDKGRLVDQLRAEAARRTHQALHDPLTGMPNRLQFTERAAAAVVAARTHERQVAVVLLDVDGFKHVNDTLGHHTGDALLQEVGRRLRAGTRTAEFAARLGGDEFAVLLDLGPVGSEPDELTEAVHRLVADLERPAEVAGSTLDVRVSAGAAVSSEHGVGLEELLQRADAAMYEAKRARGRGMVADLARGTSIASRMGLAGDLRRAIGDAQLVVDYQPTADLRTGRITGAEALVRWQHPVHGRLGPDVFIPVAEQAGLVTALTYEVLRTALADAASWARAGHELDIAVNVAARTLLEPDFPVEVLGLLARSGTAAGRLTLEVSESGLMADPDRAAQGLAHLARAGVRLAVDDVGTGWTSLAHLGSLPLAELKVDGRFVRNATGDPRARALVRSALDLAHNLGLRVVAEGMENQLTWDLLLEMGCDRGQGYLLSPPLPPQDLHAWLVRRTSARSTAPVG